MPLSPPEETVKEPKILSPKQRACVLLIAQGYSQEAAVREIEISLRTFHRWRKEPEFKAALDSMKEEFIERYERSFTSMLPEVAQKHRELVHSESQAIAMRAVDSCHQHYSRNVREQEVKTEVEELKAMVLMLTAELKQQRAG